MKRALIGYTGFVGSNLMRAGDFTDFFNSSNFQTMRGQHFDEVVCAGVSAVKWLANKEPEKDWQGIQALLEVLAQVHTSRFILISTIDVYPNPAQPLDETYEVPVDQGEPYGRHRRAIEKFVANRFAEVLIARLPALFGSGLKKNVVFDLLTGNQTDRINPATAFQWYPIHRLSADLECARLAGLGLVNLFPEPVRTAEILTQFFPGCSVGAPSEPAPRYQLRTAHAERFGGSSPYLMPAKAVMDEMARFIRAARNNPNAELA